MKLLIDLQSCQSGSRLGGIGRYSLHLTKAILEIGYNHEIYILVNNQLPEAIQEIKRELIDCIPLNRILIFESLSRVNELRTFDISRTIAAEACREHFIDMISPDCVLITSLIEGLGDDVVISVPKKQKGYSTVVILYDLIPLAQKNKYLTDNITENHYMRKLSQLRSSDR